MDNTTSDFLEDTSLTSFASPIAASTAVRNARDDTFLKAQKFSGLLQNLFVSQPTHGAGKLTFDEKSNQMHESHDGGHDSVHDNSSLGLLSLDSINELSGSTISLESRKKKSDEMETHMTEKLAHSKISRRKYSLKLDTKVPNKDFDDKTSCMLEKNTDHQKKTDNDSLLALKEHHCIDRNWDSVVSVEENDKNNKNETDIDEEFYRRVFCGDGTETKVFSKAQEKDKTCLTQETSFLRSLESRHKGENPVSEKQETEIYSPNGRWAEKCRTPSHMNDENTLTSVSETPHAPGINSKYFRPPSHLSSDEKSASNFIGFGMSSSAGRESLPNILHDSKVANEVDFRKDQIIYRSSSFGTYGITANDVEQKLNRNPPISSKLNSSISETFDITDTGSSSVNLNNLSSYLHSIKNNSQRSKHDVHKETVATVLGTSSDKDTHTITDSHTKNVLVSVGDEDQTRAQTVPRESTIMYGADETDFATDVVFQTDFCNEVLNNVFSANTFNVDVSNAKFEEFFTTDEAAKMLLEDEKEFEKAHMFEGEPIGNQTIISIGSSWMPVAQDITRPSWMTNLNESSDSSPMRISIGQFIRGKTETLGTLEGNDENAPTFGIDCLATPDKSNLCNKPYDVCSKKDANKDHQATQAANSSENILLSSSKNESNSMFKSHSDSEKDSCSSLLSMSSISKLISEVSVSEDPQVMAAKFLENVNAKKLKRKFAKKHGLTASTTFSKIQNTLQTSQDSGVHSDLKLSSDQETTSQCSSNNDKTPPYMQTVVRARPTSKYEKTTNSRKTLFSPIFSKHPDQKDFCNSNCYPAKSTLKKSLSIQELSKYGKNNEVPVPAIKSVKATSDTDLSKTLKQHTESSSQTDTCQMFPSIHRSISELSNVVNGSSRSPLKETSENIMTLPCHSGSLPNLSSEGFQQMKNNQNAARNYSSLACDRSHEMKNFLANNVPASFSQPICSTGVTAPPFLTSNHLVGHHPVSQNSSHSYATSSAFPLVNPYVTSLQSFHSLSGIPTIINNASHQSQTAANYCHGILLEKKDKQSFAGASALQYDCEPIHQFLSSSATLQNTSLRKTVELNVAEPICIGDTTQFSLVLQNPSSTPLLCNLNVNVSIDEQVLPAAVVSGFSFPHHLQIEAGGTRQVKILYTPRQSGHVAALLEVNADTSAPVFGYPLTAVINAEVEWPQVLLKIDGGNDFGAVGECHTAKRIISIINHSNVAVPIRLYISEDIQCPHSFNFGIKEINTEVHKNNVIWHFISPKVLVCQLPGKKNTGNATTLEIPLFFQTGKIKQGNSDEVSAIINATLESSVMCEALGCIKVSANVGLVRLSVKEATQGIVVFETKPKCETEKEIILQNKGTVHCRFNLNFKSSSSCFQVIPSNIELHPEQEKTIQMLFYSDHKCIQENVLQATLESGNQYQLLAVRGECKNKRERKVTVIRRNVQTSQSKQSNNCQSQLISNKSYLSWAGIAVGQSVKKKLLLRNSSRIEPLLLKLSLKGNTSGIKLEQHLALNPELHLQSQEEKPVHLIFSPAGAYILNASLIVQPVQAHSTETQYTFPLIGYSGVSRIIIEGLNRRDDGSYFLNMCPPDYQNTALSHFTISNIGQRAGYVKVLCFTDYNLVEITSADIVTSQPSEFVLHAKETKTLIVAYNHGNFIQNYSSLPKQIAVLGIFYGDEILRQKLKRALKKSDYEEYTPPHPVCNINFAVNYAGENNTSSDESYPDSPRDVEIFYSNVSRYLIGLDIPSEDSICDSTCNSITSLTGLRDSLTSAFDSTTDLEKKNTNIKYSNLSSPPVKGSSPYPCSSLDNHLPSISAGTVERHYLHPYALSTESTLDKENILDNGDSNTLELWKIEPSILSIGTEGKDGRICFTNLTDIDLRFKLQWSTNVLCVSPVQGIVLAGNSIGLRVSPIVSSPSINPKEKNIGFVKVFCGGQQKEVHVKIQNYKSSSVQKKYIKNVAKESDVSFISQTESIQVTCSKLPRTYESSVHCPEEIKLKEAVVGSYSETKFQIKNSTTDLVKWSITPVSDIFLQNEKDCNSNIAPSSTIIMNQESGLLNANGAIDIIAKFCPLVPGIYTQVWELNTGTNEQFCIHINGEGYDSTIPLSTEETPQSNISMQSRISNVTSSRGSFLQPLFPVTTTLKFPLTDLKKTTMLKAKLKNVSAVNHKISAVKPSCPFFVKHTDLIVKGKHYLNLPVYFHPTCEGHFSGNLLIHTDLDYDINIHLTGEATSS